MKLGQNGRVGDPKFTSSHRHTKIRIICRATTDEKDRNLAEKIYN